MATGAEDGGGTFLFRFAPLGGGGDDDDEWSI